MIDNVSIGATVEKAVRRSGTSVTDLANHMHVNRRSVYNWFSQKYLSIKLVKEIGDAINHDFSKDLPGLFDIESLFDKKVKLNSDLLDTDSPYYWREKYKTLLKKYNEMFKMASQKMPQSK